MWWRIRTENGGRKRGKAVLLLSGQMDDRQTDWIAGERELCKTLTGRNRWLNFKGGIENSQQRVLETAVMSSCQCQSMKYESDSCIYKFLMLQTKYSGEEEESNDENRNWEGKWKYLLLSRKKAKNCGERQMGCGSSPDVKPFLSLLRLAVMLQNTGAGFLFQHSWFRRPLPSTSSKLRNQCLVQGWILEKIWSHFFGAFQPQWTWWTAARPLW